MKSTFFVFVGLLALEAFAADSYTIQKFTGDDVGSPDSYISAEFGGTLKITQSGTVQDVQNGRFYVRQKFEDPFGESPTTYQLYEGRTGDSKSSLSQFSVPAEISYNTVVKAKCYANKDDSANADIEKVYFDGTSIYAENVQQMFIHSKTGVIELPAMTATEAPAAEPPESDASMDTSSSFAEETTEDTTNYTAPKPVVAPALAMEDSSDEYCDDNDPDCEEDTTYDVSSDATRTTAQAENDQYSANDAANDVTNRFGIADEVRKWSAWALVAVAAGSATAGVMQHMKYSDAKDAHDDLDDLIQQHKDAIKSACGDDSKCYNAMIWYETNDKSSYLSDLTERNKTNQKTMDSYSTARNIWFGVTAVSLTGAIVLFTW
ncbi:MAG: hypothetical protein M0P13_00580 [Fibrobacteraceae bacterium]|nr:hypothetical protein [Fibrobacteraceae bacterium]